MQRIRVLQSAGQGVIVRWIGGGEKGVEIIFLTADLMRCRGVRDVTWGLDLVGNNDSVYWLGNEEWELG